MERNLATPSLEELEACTTPELRERYVTVFDRTPPPRSSRYFLLDNLAWALQVRQRKQNPRTLRNQLLKRSRQKNGKKKSKERYRPGTRLVREWHGELYEVTILEKGYRWRERHYRSLTAIAREITGANWSGPRFFGLTRN